MQHHRLRAVLCPCRSTGLGARHGVGGLGEVWALTAVPLDPRHWLQCQAGAVFLSGGFCGAAFRRRAGGRFCCFLPVLGLAAFIAVFCCTRAR